MLPAETKPQVGAHSQDSLYCRLLDTSLFWFCFDAEASNEMMNGKTHSHFSCHVDWGLATQSSAGWIEQRERKSAGKLLSLFMPPELISRCSFKCVHTCVCTCTGCWLICDVCLYHTVSRVRSLFSSSLLTLCMSFPRFLHVLRPRFASPPPHTVARSPCALCTCAVQRCRLTAVQLACIGPRGFPTTHTHTHTHTGSGRFEFMTGPSGTSG